MEKRITSDDGAYTTLESWGTRGPALLCVHGMTSSRKAWARLGEHFTGTYRVFAYDQRGHGDSAAFTSPMTLERGVRDLDAVAAHVDGDIAALVGHSWGGAIVILAGPASRAGAVIAVDPVLRVMPGTWQSEYLDDAERDFALPFDELAKDLRKRLADWPPIDIEGKMHAVRQMTAEPIARLASDNRVEEGGWNILAQTEAYPKPLVVFAAGPADSVMSPDDLRELKARGGANVFIRQYPDQGHNLHRTAFDRFTADIERLLNRAEP
ncbi:MAG TPA: alpha/beta hydrolase [Candidatus Eremiobacteraceae bacterium]|nr:alpha/beta hydrolase [Candidatus Eremiobacteraceae bacterium]